MHTHDTLLKSNKNAGMAKAIAANQTLFETRVVVVHVAQDVAALGSNREEN